MSDTSGSPLVPSRDARLTPESVAERGFSQVKRGYSETEVRAFLRLVADELASLTGHERDLANRVRSLEERLSAPKPVPSDQDLIAALGEETARVLGQAREAAVELRTKADEHARRVVREAQESARELRASTQQAVEAKAREAEDAARSRAKEIVGEARTLRERVLTDLTERRQELERQIAELRSGRGRLVETYQAVERALSQAARVMADEPPASTVATPAPAAPEQADAPAAPAAPDAPVADAAPGSDTAEAEAPAESETAAETETEASTPGAPDLGALFEQLRSEQTPVPDADAPDAAATSAESDDAPAAATQTASSATTEAPDEDAGEPSADDEGDGGDERAEEVALTPDQRLVKARDDVLDPIAVDLSRRAKRALQDEQNDVLDGLRRQRGKIDTTKILPAADEQQARWAHVLQPAVDRAYAAGRASVGGPTGKGGGSVAGAVLTELTDAAVTPLRSRLESSLQSIDAKSPADLEITIAQALGARYREWRTQDLDVVLGDALSVAWSRGVYDAAPADARLRWIPAREGKCPDCDDNALEPTTRGEAFPTGQLLPPAHPGCRCMLVVEPTE